MRRGEVKRGGGGLTRMCRVLIAVAGFNLDLAEEELAESSVFDAPPPFPPPPAPPFLPLLPLLFPPAIRLLTQV